MGTVWFRSPVSKPDATERSGSVSADKQTQVAVWKDRNAEVEFNKNRRKIPLMPVCSLESTFGIVDVFKVLALDNFFNDVISVHSSVVHPRGVVLHRVLLPPETKCQGGK